MWTLHAWRCRMVQPGGVSEVSLHVAMISAASVAHTAVHARCGAVMRRDVMVILKKQYIILINFTPKLLVLRYLDSLGA